MYILISELICLLFIKLFEFIFLLLVCVYVLGIEIFGIEIFYIIDFSGVGRKLKGRGGGVRFYFKF